MADLHQGCPPLRSPEGEEVRKRRYICDKAAKGKCPVCSDNPCYSATPHEHGDEVNPRFRNVWRRCKRRPGRVMVRCVPTNRRKPRE